MCLYKIKKLNKKKGITCYKVLYAVPNGSGGLSMLSLIKDYPYEMGVVHSTNTNSPQIDYIESTHEPYIRGSSLHSLKTLYGAKKMVKFFLKQKPFMLPMNSIAIIIVKCVIPSDSNFIYKGRFLDKDFNLRSYASEKLEPIEIVKYYPIKRK